MGLLPAVIYFIVAKRATTQRQKIMAGHVLRQVKRALPDYKYQASGDRFSGILKRSAGK